MKRFLKYIWYSITFVAIMLTGYYYLYLGIINPEWDEKRTVIKEKEVISEEVEPLSAINDILNEMNTPFSKYLKVVFAKKQRWRTVISIKIKDADKINELFWSSVMLNQTLKNELSLDIRHWRLMNSFTIKWKINSRSVYVSGEFDDSYIYLNEVLLNGMFSMIDQSRLDLFLDDIWGYIDYSTLTNKKIETIPLNPFDDKIWQSKKDLFKAMVSWVGEVFKCSKTECKLTISENTPKDIMSILLQSESLSQSQKSSISALSKELVNYLVGTKFYLTNGNFNIDSNNKKLIFDISYDYEDNSVEYTSDTNRSKYELTDFDKMSSLFEKNNPLFMSVISNKKDIIPLITNE